MISDQVHGRPSFFRLIYLYGPPGSGKSSIGKVLAQNLALPFVDLDQRIEDQAGMSIADIFNQQGEARFRELEKIALREVSTMEWGVIALGGGALVDPGSRSLAEDTGSIVCLSAEAEVLYERLISAQDERPLLMDDSYQSLAADRLGDLLARRAQHYASFPHQLETHAGSPEQLSWEIQIDLGAFHLRGMLAQPAPGDPGKPGLERPFPLGYDVRFSSALDSLGDALRRRGLSGPVALVTDQNVAGYYLPGAINALEAAGYRVFPITITPGETSKTMQTVSYLWQEFLEGGVERRSTVVAMGGGVVGDLAGFAAATYMRGIPWVSVPTSLLAMVDASLGGKTGADLPAGKNLVGAFYAPQMVLIDAATLRTLPQPELHSGMAEVVKSAVIGDPRLFQICSQDWPAIEENWNVIIPCSMAVKIRIIESDPYEKGQRAALNFGHTFGHAVEVASAYEVRHGEAVAIGMVAETRLSEQLGIAGQGLADEIKNVCSQLGLPVEIPKSLSRSSILEAMQVDKKRSSARFVFALPRQIGEVLTGIEVDDFEKLLG